MATSRKAAHGLTQLAGSLAVLYGIHLWSVPAAWIVGGVAAFAWVEVRSG